MRTREGYGRELQLMIDPKLHHNMLVRIEELEAGEGGEKLKLVRELLQRERNLSASERAASSAEGVFSAKVSAFEERFTELTGGLDTRHNSIKSGRLLLPTALAEAQAEQCR